MANPIPCDRCGQVADAEFVVTDRTPDFAILGAPTQGICARCMVMLGEALRQALEAAYAEQEEFRKQWEADHPEEASGEVQALAESVGTEPGVLEQVEAEEGRVHPAPQSASTKRKSRASALVAAAEAAQKAEASDVDG